jgi:hypothetical protein
MTLVIAKVEAAIVALETLMLDDVWDAVPAELNRAGIDGGSIPWEDACGGQRLADRRRVARGLCGRLS